MTANNRIYNFSAGPAILPPAVFKRAADAVMELRGNGHHPNQPGIGLSLLEISHRSKEFAAVAESAEELCHEVLGIPKTHKVLFLQGGASLQFAMVPMNIGRDDAPACYIDTGAWSKKAIKESKIQGPTEVLASSAETTYDHIPDWPEMPAKGSYLHITTNNTIYGTEYPEIPTTPDHLPLVVDCSSHIGSRAMDFSKVALGYAGAQKNLGPSGLTLVFIRKDLLEVEPKASTPTFLRYKTHADADSMFNTPNTFGVLVLKLVLEWMKENGGLEGMEKRNRAKADKLYQALDASSLYKVHPKEGHRSLMNVPWTLAGAAENERDELTARFVKESAAAGLSGLKGHRSVGGCRASIYNAFPPEGIDMLVDFLNNFEKNA